MPLDKIWSTPGPWLVRFFRSGKNPHEPNPHHLTECEPEMQAYFPEKLN